MIVLATRFHQRAHILPKFLERRPPNKPPSIVDRVDCQVRSQRESVRKCDQAVFEICWGHLHDFELTDGLTLVVTKKSICRSQSGAEGRTDFRRVGANSNQLAVVDLQVLL